MKKKYLYLFLRVLGYLLVLGAILYGLYESPYNPHPHSAEDIRRWVVGFGVWAPLIYVVVYTIRPLLLFQACCADRGGEYYFCFWVALAVQAFVIFWDVSAAAAGCCATSAAAGVNG